MDKGGSTRRRRKERKMKKVY